MHALAAVITYRSLHPNPYPLSSTASTTYDLTLQSRILCHSLITSFVNKPASNQGYLKGRRACSRKRL
jgi:hypothetical protein